MPRVNQIQLRRDAASAWTAVNPILAAGEVGLETDTRLMKAGDGTTNWNSLSYLASSIADGAVSTNKIGDSQVTTNKIGNLQVTEAKLADNAVATAKIGDGQITTAKFNSAASIGLVNSKSFMVQTTQPTTRPGGGALVAGDVWISYTVTP